MSKFVLTEILHMAQPTSHPESVAASRIPNSAKHEVNVGSSDRLHTLTAAVTNAAMHADEHFVNPLTMPEYNPRLHDPQMRQQEELIDPNLAYAKANIDAIGRSPAEDAAYAREQSAHIQAANASVADAFFQEVGVAPAVANQQLQHASFAPETNQAVWNIADDAGMANPSVPKVVEDIDRLAADLSQEQTASEQAARANLDQIYAEMGK